MVKIKDNIEIERKFLLNNLILIDRIIDKIEPSYIEQVYLSNNPQIRMRRIDNETFTLNIKFGRGLSRTELKGKVTGNFALLFDDKKLIKQRYEISEAEVYTIEIDVYINPANLIIAEVEFDSEEDALSYEFPAWFKKYVVKEVTNDIEYSNQRIFERL